MATTTTKLGLTKPDYSDNVDVADLNTNADKLDAAAGFTIVANAAARPASPWTGQVIYQVDVTSSFMWDGSAWQPAGGGGGSIEISATAPASPSAGDLWWDSDNGNLYIYYDDGDSQQWVAANGPQVFVGTSAPAGYQGQLWFDSTDGKTYIYYDDGTSSQWVSAIGGSLSGNVIQVVSTTKTDTFSASISASSEAAITGLSASITPKSTSSKILVIYNVNGARDTDDYVFLNCRIKRDSTVIGSGDTAGSRVTANSAQNLLVTANGVNQGNVSGQFLDSPASTSSLTYQIYLADLNATGGPFTYVVNRAAEDSDGASRVRTASTITLMEIAG